MNKKVLGGIILSLAVVLVVALAFVPKLLQGSSAAKIDSSSLIQVTGVIGSEKAEYFKDQTVIDRFAELGYQVNVTTAGSREIATSVDLTKYDFAFPSSTAAATKIAEDVGANKTYSPFYSPMVVATWTPIVKQLEKIGVASQTNGVWYLDVAKYLETVAAGTRWSDLPDAASVYNNSRSILIGSTNIATSNSAAMYASIAAYVLNGDNVISTDAEEQAVLPQISTLFTKQGFTASSSSEPFSDYLNQGIGSKPLVMAYEAQYIEQALSSTGLPSDATVAYLSPTVLSKHVIVPLDDVGDTIGNLIATDPTLQQLAAQHGFRTSASEFSTVVGDNNISGIQTDITNVGDIPNYDMLEKLIDDIVAVY